MRPRNAETGGAKRPVRWKNLLGLFGLPKLQGSFASGELVMRFLTILLLFLFSTPVFALSFSGKVVKVSDGDTIEVLRDGHAEKIRLSGIDCPEKKQAFGQAAKRFTLALAAQKIVTVNVETTDRYGRTVGEVVLPGGRSLNRELVRAGYAWYSGPRFQDNSLRWWPDQKGAGNERKESQNLHRAV
jgi:endonuclease YncB( thermonuclease family)